MNRETVTFDGGINNITAPHLISDNMSPYVANALITDGVLTSAKESKIDTTLTVDGQYATYYKAKDKIVSSSEDRFYVEWAGFLYWSNYKTDGTGKIQRYDGTDVLDLGGHTPPDTAPTVATDGAGLLWGDYSYCYTYIYDEVFETAPSDITELASVDNQKIKISGIPTSGLDPAPTHVIIYRSGGMNPTFNQVNRIEFGTSEYIDNTSDFTISRKELKTGTNDAPPANIDMLVESGGTLFGAVGDKIHFSAEGQPEFWSDYNYVQLPTPVTGLGVIGGTVIAFTEESMFAIRGKNIQTISIDKLPFQYGCIDKRTVQNIQGSLIWLTKLDEYDLLCSFNGGSVEVLNYTNLGVVSVLVGNFEYNSFDKETYDTVSLDILNSSVVGRRYFLFLSGRTIVLDFENGLKTYYMEEEVFGAFEYHNDMMVIKESIDVTTNFDVYRYLVPYAHRRDLSYITKDYSNGSLTRDKAYRKVHVNGTGKWGISVYVDTIFKFSFDHSNGDSIFLPAGTHGKLINFSIKSDGWTEIKSITYEYDELEYGYATVPLRIDRIIPCDLTVGGKDGTEYYTAFTWNSDCSMFKT